MTSRHRNVIGNAYITILSTTNLNLTVSSNHFRACINHIKGLLAFIWQRFQNNIVAGWFVNTYDINYLVVISYTKRKVDLAQFTVKLFKSDYLLILVCSHRSFSLKPAFKTLQMDSSHGTSTFTRRYQWINLIKSLFEVFFLCTPTDTADYLTFISQLSLIFLSVLSLIIGIL